MEERITLCGDNCIECPRYNAHSEAELKRVAELWYTLGESIAFDFENGSGTYTYQGKIAGSFVSADTYLVIPEGVYRSMNPRGTAYGYLCVYTDQIKHTARWFSA